MSFPWSCQGLQGRENPGKDCSNPKSQNCCEVWRLSVLASLCEQVPWRGGQSSLSSLTLEPRYPLLPSLGGSKSVSLNCVLSPFTPQDSVPGKEVSLGCSVFFHYHATLCCFW